MMLIFQAVLAAEPSAYALRATVDLPPAGPARVALGPDLVGGDPDALAGGLALVDADGGEVPYAVLRTSQGSADETGVLDFRPTDLSTWETEGSPTPVDQLSLDVSDLSGIGPVDATVAWRVGDTWIQAPPELLYDVGGPRATAVDVPHVRGPFRVSLAARSGARARLAGVEAVWRAPDHVPPIVEEFQASAPVLQEDGSARWVIHLGSARALRSVRVRVAASAPVFERSVTVRMLAPGDAYAPAESSTLRRVRVGSANVDVDEVSASSLAGDTLLVDVPTERGAVLPIEGFEVVSEGAWLVVNDAGRGPHTLYAASTEAADAFGLATALPELLRGDPPVVTPRDVGPNPAFVPAPTRAGVDAPGPDLSLNRFHFERPIEGAIGWVRLRLGTDVLTRTRPDVADVRVVDADGRQVPFLLEETGEADEVRDVTFSRTEDGRFTELRIPIASEAPIATLEISTSRPVFERPVTVLREAGVDRETLRQVLWSGPERGGRLTLSIGERVGRALFVRIDNGDDAPLPIDAVRVSTPVRDLRANVPEGARLVYGAPGAGPPEYDLSLLQDDVRRMLVQDATLGPERELTPPTPPFIDRAAAFAGVGVLVVGLLGLLVRALRGVPATTDEAPPA